jgi:hypothetical protein
MPGPCCAGRVLSQVMLVRVGKGQVAASVALKEQMAELGLRADGPALYVDDGDFSSPLTSDGYDSVSGSSEEGSDGDLSSDG